MQRWVIGGACLLAILSSIGRGEEIGDSKQLKESVRTKGTEFSAEKQAIDDLNFDNLTTPLESSKNLTSSSQVLGQTSSEETLSVNTPLKENFIQPLAKKSEEDVGENSSLIPQGSASLNVDQNAKFISKEHKETDKNDNVYSSGLNILPPLYSAPLTASSNKAVRDESPFSPVFSRDITDHSVYELPADPQNNLKRAGFGTLPSYSYISKTAFEESRRESKPDDLQTRDIDEREYSETRNAYPYSSSSGKLDTTSGKTNELRSGLTYAPSYPLQQNTGTSSAQAYAGTQVQSLNDKLSLNNQGYNPYSFGYPPDPVPKPISTINANAQASANGMSNAQSSATVIEDAKSRIIWPNELIFPSKIPGAENEIQCTRENEMYHYWSRSFECLICICLNVYGLLEPICAKCSGCRGPQSPAPQTFIPDQSFPTPDTYRPLPVPDSYVPLPILSTDSSAPSAPSLIVEPIGNQDIQLTTQLPVREVPATCRPLPTDRPFTNPLHPCQICICRETITSLGKIDVRIECQDNNDCVLPVDVTPLPIIPDIPVPVPLPHCEKFPPHVPFPHPTDSCKLCKCSLQLSSEGLSEQQITCYRNTDCVKKIEVTSEPITPPAPPIPIPVEPYPGPVPQPAVKPIPENYQKDLIPWPPISTPAPPLVPLLPKKGPLPGPSPHDSCRPYPPNQSFQHPWDDCQVCQCTETKAIGVVNVEINCYTKLSCCIESPENVISAAAGKKYIIR